MRVISSAAAVLLTVTIAFRAVSTDLDSAGFGRMSWILNGYWVVFAGVLAVAGR